MDSSHVRLDTLFVAVFVGPAYTQHPIARSLTPIEEHDTFTVGIIVKKTLPGKNIRTVDHLLRYTE